jgi:hypothetical protein
MRNCAHRTSVSQALFDTDDRSSEMRVAAVPWRCLQLSRGSEARRQPGQGIIKRLDKGANSSK